MLFDNSVEVPEVKSFLTKLSILRKVQLSLAGLTTLLLQQFLLLSLLLIEFPALNEVIYHDLMEDFW